METPFEATNQEEADEAVKLMQEQIDKMLGIEQE
jgi:hypothetical protein